MDNATPSGSSMVALGFLKLEALTGDTRYGEHARTLLRSLGPLIGRHALAFGHLAWAAELEAAGVTEIVISGDRPDLVDAVRRRFLPTSVLAWGEPFDGPLWEGRAESGDDRAGLRVPELHLRRSGDHAGRAGRATRVVALSRRLRRLRIRPGPAPPHGSSGRR